MSRESRSEQIKPGELEKKFQELDKKLIKASTRGRQKDVEKILDETSDVIEERNLLDESERLNKKRILN